MKEKHIRYRLKSGRVFVLCATRTQEERENLADRSGAMKKSWTKERRKTHSLFMKKFWTKERRKTQSLTAKKLWTKEQRLAFSKKMEEKHKNDKEYVKKIIESRQTAKFRRKMGNISLQRWKDKDMKKIFIDNLNKTRTHRKYKVVIEYIPEPSKNVVIDDSL
jgi:hypothetical protein